MEEWMNYSMQNFDETSLLIRNLEEKQRVLRDRLLLIGENLVEIKEETNEKMLEIKKDIQYLKQTLERALSFLESFSSEISNFARKEEVELLKKQARMFQPLEVVRMEDLKHLMKNI